MCGQSLWFIKYRVAHTQLPSSLEGQIIMILNSSDAFKRADYSFFFFLLFWWILPLNNISNTQL